MVTHQQPPAYSESASADQMNSDVPEKGQIIEVLVLGETQNGKSTMIKQLGRYGGKPDMSIGIGNGNVSCTRIVNKYPFTTDLRSYRLEDIRGQEIKNMAFTDMVDLTTADAKAVPNAPDQGGKKFTFRFMDTPGLDDSSGNDLEIMADIVGRVGDLSHLNAVIYVRNLNRPFGNSFVTFYNYIRRCMPGLCDGLIVCHTGFTVDRVDQAQSQGQDLYADRISAFKKQSGQPQADFAHFFMDNAPDRQSPFAVADSFMSCYHLLTLLSTQLPIDTKNLKLLKTPIMQQVDVHVELELEQLHQRLKGYWERELAEAKKDKSRALRTEAEITRLRSSVQEYDRQLEDLDSDTSIVLGTKHVGESFGIKNVFAEGSFWLENRHVAFDADCTIDQVIKHCTGRCTFVNEVLRGTTWRAEISGGFMRSINATATFYTTSKLKYAKTIAHLKESRRNELANIGFHQESAAGQEGLDATGADAKAVKLAEDIEKCKQVLKQVKSETFNVLLWHPLKRIYTSQKNPSKGEIVEFVKVYDPDVARLIYGLGWSW